MIVTDYKSLEKKLDKAHALMKSVKSEEESIALANYIGNLYESMIIMGKDDVKVDFKATFKSKRKHHKFVRKLDVYSDDLFKNFVLNKEFHSQYIGELLPDIEEEIYDICAIPSPPEVILSDKDFFEIFYTFLSHYNLESEFDELYRKGHIFSSVIGNGERNLGSTLYNPINRDIDMFITNFQYNYSCMSTLAHEFGHGMDLNRFSEGIDNYNRYFYSSIYGEVFSRLMERLLHQFCLRNGILEDQARDSYINFEDLNHDYLLQSYILSLLDDSFIYSGGFRTCTSDIITKKVSKFFTDDDAIKSFIGNSDFDDLGEILTYTYGDIISLFLMEDVQRYGFSNDLVDYFLENRSSLFSEEYMRECGFGPKNYIKLYKKEIELIKK